MKQSNDQNRDNFSYSQLKLYISEIERYLSPTVSVGKIFEDFKEQVKSRVFIFEGEEYSRLSDISIIKTFLGEVKKDSTDPNLKEFIIAEYIKTGRMAANEYIKIMVEGYRDNAGKAVINKGWETFRGTGESTNYQTYREAAGPAVAQDEKAT